MPGYGQKPFGLREVRLIKGATVISLPAATKLSFKERIVKDELKGNDKIVGTAAISEAVDWEIDQGGISLEAYALMTGRSAVESGVAPNRVDTMTGRAQDTFPYFKAYGKSVGDGTDDMWCVLFQMKLTEFDGSLDMDKFEVSKCKGLAVDDGVNGVFQFVQHETATALPTT